MTKYRTDSLYRNTEVVNSKYLDVLSIVWYVPYVEN